MARRQLLTDEERRLLLGVPRIRTGPTLHAHAVGSGERSATLCPLTGSHSGSTPSSTNCLLLPDGTNEQHTRAVPAPPQGSPISAIAAARRDRLQRAADLVPRKNLEYSGLDGAFRSHCRLRWFGLCFGCSGVQPQPTRNRRALPPQNRDCRAIPKT